MLLRRAVHTVPTSKQNYPFGMMMPGISLNLQDPDNSYQYNGKEHENDLHLGWIDYGARWYDPTVGRWWSVDPLADSYSAWSPYNYVLDNPISNIDPDGRTVLTSTAGKSFYIDDQYGDYEFEVTDAQFEEIVSSNPTEGWYNNLSYGPWLRWKMGTQSTFKWNSDGFHPDNSLSQEIGYLLRG